MSWNLMLEVLIAAVGTIAFSILFQVNPRHHFFCGLVGGIGWLVYRLVTEASGSAILATFVATLVLSACSRWFSTLRHTPTIVFLVCGIFTLVPGVPLTFAVRNFMENDYIAGLVRLTDAVLVAGCIAVGVGSVMIGWNTLLGGIVL